MAIGDPTKPVAPKQPPAPQAPPPPNPSAAIGGVVGGASGNIQSSQQLGNLLAGLQQNLSLSGTNAQADLARKTYAQQLQNALAQYGLQNQQLQTQFQGFDLSKAQAQRQAQDQLRQLYGQRGAAGALTTAGTGYQRGLVSQQLKDALARLNLQWQNALLSRQGIGMNATQAQQAYANNLAQLGLSQGQSASQAQLAYLQAVAQNAQTANTAEQNLFMPFLQTLLQPGAGVT